MPDMVASAWRAQYLVFSFNIGTNNIGFYIYDKASQRCFGGVRVFDAPFVKQNRKSGINGPSKTRERGEYRRSRRTKARQKARRRHVFALLKQAGLVPEDVDRAWLQMARGDESVTTLRARALDEQISDRALAQVLYLIAKRRGYVSHGRGGVRETDDEKSQMLSAMTQTARDMEAAGARTIGEWYFMQGRSRNRNPKDAKPGKEPDFSKLARIEWQVAEVRQILAVQRSFGNKCLTQDFEDSFIAEMTWEADGGEHDDAIYDKVGECVYFPANPWTGEPGKKRAAKADLSFQICSALEALGNVRILGPDGTETRLSKDVRDQAMSTWFAAHHSGEVTYARLRAWSDMPTNSVFKDVKRKDEDKREPFKPTAWRKMAAVLPEGLLTRMLKDRPFADDVCEALTYSSTEQSLMRALEKVDLTDDEEEAVFDVPFDSAAFSGYGARSRKALEMLIDAFDEGAVDLYDAEVASGLYELRTMERHNRTVELESYSTYDKTCDNPVVLRALAQMRQIFNALVRRYGSPAEVYVTVCRDLRFSDKTRAKQAKRARDRHAAARRKAAEVLGCEPDDVSNGRARRTKMWMQQGGVDIYTGEPLDLTRVLVEQGYAQEDHILPYSRVADDSQENRVIVLTESNFLKGSRTPYEWMASGEENAPDWGAFQVRVQSCEGLVDKVPKLFREKPIEDSVELVDHYLSDTAYASIAVRNWVRDTICFDDPEGWDLPAERVHAIAGRAVGMLRKRVGLNIGPNGRKDPFDPKSSVVDAAVASLCTPKVVMGLIGVQERRRSYGGKAEYLVAKRAALPWDTFDDDVRACYRHVIPTFAVNHRMTGKAFKETFYPYVGTGEDGRVTFLEKGSPKTSVTARKVGDGIKKPADMSALRLWWDPSFSKDGSWRAEPLYAMDSFALADGSYRHRLWTKTHLGLDMWDDTFEGMEGARPLELHRNDLVLIGGKTLIKYCSWSVLSNSMTYEVVYGDGTFSDTPERKSIRQLIGRELDVKVISQDCLGMCYEPYRHLLPEREPLAGAKA